MKTDERLTPWQFVMLVLSLYVLGGLFVETVVRLNRDTARILQYFDTAICVLFIYDFCARLYGSKDRLAFLKWGWVDLVSSIPMLDAFRWGRTVRLIRILRLLRAFRSTKALISYFLSQRANGAFASATLISITLVLFSSIAILHLEDSATANIKGAEDAVCGLWSRSPRLATATVIR